jgi:Domain of unknown function (DUF397)
VRRLTLQNRSGLISVGPQWVKSSLSGAGGDCVEVASMPGGRIGVRDSKDTQGAILRFTPAEWNAFIGGVRIGEFDHFGQIR